MGCRPAGGIARIKKGSAAEGTQRSQGSVLDTDMSVLNIIPWHRRYHRKIFRVRSDFQV